MGTSTADLIAEIRQQARTAYRTGDPDRAPEDENDADPLARIDVMRDQLAGILDSVRELETASTMPPVEGRRSAARSLLAKELEHVAVRVLTAMETADLAHVPVDEAGLWRLLGRVALDWQMESYKRQLKREEKTGVAACPF